MYKLKEVLNQELQACEYLTIWGIVYERDWCRVRRPIIAELSEKRRKKPMSPCRFLKHDRELFDLPIERFHS